MRHPFIHASSKRGWPHVWDEPRAGGARPTSTAPLIELVRELAYRTRLLGPSVRCPRQPPERRSLVRFAGRAAVRPSRSWPRTNRRGDGTLLVLNRHMLRATAPPTSPTTFAQLKSRARKEEEHREHRGKNCHHENNKDRSRIHNPVIPADPSDKRTTAAERPLSAAGGPTDARFSASACAVRPRSYRRARVWPRAFSGKPKRKMVGVTATQRARQALEAASDRRAQTGRGAAQLPSLDAVLGLLRSSRAASPARRVGQVGEARSRARPASPS
jgi:hypothetical protein